MRKSVNELQIEAKIRFVREAIGDIYRIIKTNESDDRVARLLNEHENLVMGMFDLYNQYIKEVRAGYALYDLPEIELPSDQFGGMS